MKRTTTTASTTSRTFLFLLLTSTVTGFSTIHTRISSVASTSNSKIAALPPDAIHSTASHLAEVVSSSHQLLADAVAAANLADVSDAASLADISDVATVANLADVSSAAADATAAATADTPAMNMGPEWWQSYLRVFKNTLMFIHSTIDGPLNSIGFSQTWGVSIALFTIAMRSLLIPLSIQQNKNSEYMKALKPYMNEVKEKFKDNEQARNQALGKLFEDANQNPLSGCAVSLAQLPILLGLYRGIRLLAIDGQLEEPFLWIPSLEGPVTAETNYRGLDWLTQGWVDGVPALGWETTLAFLAMPILLVITQSITMNVLSPPMDDNMSDEERDTFEKSQLVLKFLPFMIGFFSLQVPAGLTIYWFTTNLFTLSQSLAVRTYFKMNPPKIELPEYWENVSKKDVSEMTPQERREAVEGGLSIGPTMEDLMDEAKFHSFIERVAVRSESEAWEKVSKGEIEAVVPPELEEWVKSQKAVNGVNGATTIPIPTQQEEEPAAETTQEQKTTTV